MIDWRWVIANALWICGAALALAAVSYASWTASIRHQPTRMVLRHPAPKSVLYAAAVLFCLGLASTATALLVVIIWLALAFLFAVQFILNWRVLRRTRYP